MGAFSIIFRKLLILILHNPLYGRPWTIPKTFSSKTTSFPSLNYLTQKKIVIDSA
jgi:hypothetical protein